MIEAARVRCSRRLLATLEHDPKKLHVQAAAGILKLIAMFRTKAP
jgi:hypothetical protein